MCISVLVSKAKKMTAFSKTNRSGNKQFVGVLGKAKGNALYGNHVCMVRQICWNVDMEIF